MVDKRDDLLKGTLDLLILSTLERNPMHGWGIAERIKLSSGDILQVPTGSLYPALQRLQKKGLIKAEWKKTDQNRRARYYKLTSAGRKQLALENESWNRSSIAINSVLRAAF